MPDDRKGALAQGEFPEVVEFIQGKVTQRVNLLSGERSYRQTRPGETDRRPGSTFRIIKIGTTPPRILRDIDQGAFRFTVSPTAIEFKQDVEALPAFRKRPQDRTFGR